MRITEVFIAEHPLWEEFRAKMIAYPTVSTELDNAVFQGVNRSSMQLLHNFHAGQYMDCEIDYFGTVAERTRNRSALEALLIAPDPVKIDFGDGFFYLAVLQKISGVQNDTEVFSSVSYRFRVTRHTDPVTIEIDIADESVYCRSTVPLTDCRLVIPQAAVLDWPTVLISINADDRWFFSTPVTGDVVLDVINKIFTMGGDNITNDDVFSWTSFPALKPGKNSVRLGTQGVPVYPFSPLSMYYMPTYL